MAPTDPLPSRARRVVAALAVLAAVLAGCTADQQDEPAQRTSPAPEVASGPASPPQTAGRPAAPAAGGIPAVVDKAEPSVVTIFAAGGSGSGVVWSADGLVVTNHHVVAQSLQGDRRVEVALVSGRRVPGRVRASDEITDLAVVQVEDRGLQPATFQRQLPEVGELAVVIGSPLGLENTVTAGIISGLHREIPGSARESQSLVDLIQTDAPISPGNSGGAVVNGQGQVVGISEAYIPPAAGAVSIGFAIPAATAVDVVSQLLRTGRATHAFFGIQPAQVTEEVAQQLSLDNARGVLVLEVVPGGPAAKAGIQPGDVLTRIGDTVLDSPEEFLGSLRREQPGKRVAATVVRGGRERKVTVTLAERPPG